MSVNKIINEIERLNFEDVLWLTFISLGILNILGDFNEKEYLKTKNNKYKNTANKIFEFTLIITFIIYIYFFIRNYNSYINASEDEKKLFVIKVLGSSFLIAGIVCLIYFQFNQDSFIGAPAV